jgi:hypothetical protein
MQKMLASEKHGKILKDAHHAEFAMRDVLVAAYKSGIIELTAFRYLSTDIGIIWAKIMGEVERDFNGDNK